MTSHIKFKHGQSNLASHNRPQMATGKSDVTDTRLYFCKILSLSRCTRNTAILAIACIRHQFYHTKVNGLAKSMARERLKRGWWGSSNLTTPMNSVVMVNAYTEGD